jgi:SAM-dependent methyltransferase
VIADVGSGTGILTELFIRNGNTVLAVEPNDEMRKFAERSLRSESRFCSLNPTAEQIALPDASVDGVVVAQAFHWFDGPRAAAEFRRILKPGGFIALIWNVRDPALSPFAAEYERIVHAYGSEFARSGKEVVSAQRLGELFGPHLRKLVLPNSQSLDWPGLRGRLLSASYMPLAGEPGYEPMMADLRRAFDVHQRQGQVRLEYETRVFLVQQTPE